MRLEKIPIHVDYSKVGAQKNAYQPTLMAYILDSSMDMPHMIKKPAVIICPGGGYVFKSDREAEPIAMRYLAAGIHAFVLQYSVAPARYPIAVLELAAAVQLVRERAEAYSILPNQIYIAGFSAGGHLCASLGTLWNEPLFTTVLDQGNGKDWRPDGMILSYPVITMGLDTHGGSRDSLLGENASEDMIAALSLEKRVSEKTVPTFLWHTVADEAVPVENSMMFATALRKYHIPFEMHLYEEGVHGLSLCDATTQTGPEHIMPDNADWMQKSIRWIERRKG